MPSSRRIRRPSKSSPWLHERGDNYLDARRSLTTAVTDTGKGLSAQVEEVAGAISRIANDSLQFAKDAVAGIDLKTAIYVVSSDISGAINGAATGGQLGGKWGAVVGAAIGSVSGSANAVFDPKLFDPKLFDPKR